MFALNRNKYRRASFAAKAGSGLSVLLDRLMRPLARRSIVGGCLELLGTLPLTAQSSLALVRFHNETLLLGITPNQIAVLTKNHSEAKADAKGSQTAARLFNGHVASSRDSSELITSGMS